MDTPRASFRHSSRPVFSRTLYLGLRRRLIFASQAKYSRPTFQNIDDAIDVIEPSASGRDTCQPPRHFTPRLRVTYANFSSASSRAYAIS